MADREFNNVNISVEFEETANRQQISSGDNIKTLFGKIKKWFSDLKTVAFTGSYNDLTNKPNIPTVNNGRLTIQKNGTNVQTFTANQTTNATANIIVPTKVSDLENDSGYKTTDTIYIHPTTSGNKHIPSGGSSGQILRWSANGTAVWGADNNTIYTEATQSTNGLMSASDKTKLDGISANANYYTYTHPSYTPETSGLYKITVDSTGHVSATAAVTKTDITNLGIPETDTNTTYSAATESTQGLMTAADKKKLNEIASGANAYVHPSYTAKSSGLYKITVDETGHVSNTSTVNQSDITALGIASQDHSHNYAASTTPGGPAISLSYKHVTDVSVNNSKQLIISYSDNTSRILTIEAPVSYTGKITGVTSNSTSYGYVQLDSPLQENKTYDIRYEGADANKWAGDYDADEGTSPSYSFGDSKNLVVKDSEGKTVSAPVHRYFSSMYNTGAWERYNITYDGTAFTLSGDGEKI